MSGQIKICKCGKPMFWAETSEGKRIPLDPKAPVYRVERDLTGKEVAVRAEAWVSHFATCPKADEFSGRNKR